MMMMIVVFTHEVVVGQQQQQVQRDRSHTHTVHSRHIVDYRYHSAGEEGRSVRDELDFLEVPGVDWAGGVGFLGLQSLMDAPLHITSSSISSSIDRSIRGEETHSRVVTMIVS